MNILSCKTPEMIAKESWVYILGYNLYQAADGTISCNNRFTTNGFELQTLSTIMAELSPANSDTG
jgi:hypothetical protein